MRNSDMGIQITQYQFQETSFYQIWENISFEKTQNAQLFLIPLIGIGCTKPGKDLYVI